MQLAAIQISPYIGNLNKAKIGKNMSNEIAIIENINSVEIFKKGGARQIIDAIRAEFSGEIPDLETKKGRNRIASLAYKVVRSKTALDKAGKEFADRLNEQLKPINAERKFIRDELDSLSDEIRRPLTDWENSEKERVASLKSRVQWFSDACKTADEFGNEYSSINLSGRLEVVKATKIDDGFQEFAADAAKAKDAAIAWLTGAVKAKQTREAEAIELERMRKEAAARERMEHEKRIAEDAAARAKAEAEAAAAAEIARQQRAIVEAAEREERMKREAEAAAIKAKAAAVAAELRRIEAKEKAKRDAEEAAERARLTEIARQQAELQRIADETAKREADKNHRKVVNRTAMNAIISESGVSSEQAIAIVSAIVKNLIPNVTIKY